MIKYIKKILDKLILNEKSPKNLALSFCVGNFAAWAPIIPLQTPLLVFLNYIFGFNQTVAITALYTINNPFTLIPIYIGDYFFGKFLFEKIMKINMADYNPAWADKFSSFLSRWIDIKKYIGEPVFCIWNLLFGGLILALITSIILYPIALYIFQHILKYKQNENHSTK